METYVCKKCGMELPIENFKLTRWGTRAAVCNDCVTSARIASAKRIADEKEQERQKQIDERKLHRLSDFTPRELMEELARRGYEGKLTYTEVHEIDITNF